MGRVGIDLCEQAWPFGVDDLYWHGMLKGREWMAKPKRAV
jgi:hypothetical protein